MSSTIRNTIAGVNECSIPEGRRCWWEESPSRRRSLFRERPVVSGILTFLDDLLAHYNDYEATLLLNVLTNAIE